MRFATRWLAWLCLSLMVLTAVAESTHNHANQTESASCPICVVAHSTAPASSTHQFKPIFATVSLLSAEEFSTKSQLGLFELGIRGPPEA